MRCIDRSDAGRRRFPWLAEVACLFLTLVFALAPATRAQWESECAAPAEMPEVEGEFTPIPRPGMWEVEGLGNAKRFQLEVEQCGERLTPGGAGVKLEHGIELIPLDRTPSGDYVAQDAYTRDGYTLTLHWKLTPRSSEEMSGILTLFGARNLELRYLEGFPVQQTMDCECEEIRRKRAEYVQLREGYRSAGATEATGEEVNEAVDEEIELGGGEAVTEWATNISTCAIRQGSLDEDYSTERTFQVAARSGFDHEAVHRERCCAMNRERADWDADNPELPRLEGSRLIDGLSQEQEALYQRLLAERPPTYTEWSEDPANDASDEIEGYDAGIATLDRWLSANCSDG